MTYDNCTVNVKINAPWRGRVVGKLTRLPGVTGTIKAVMDINQRYAYKFTRWVDLDDGQTLGTDPVLELTDWRSRNIEAVFDDIILDNNFFKERDAETTWVHMKESFGTRHNRHWRYWENDYFPLSSTSDSQYRNKLIDNQDPKHRLYRTAMAKYWSHDGSGITYRPEYTPMWRDDYESSHDYRDFKVASPGAHKWGYSSHTTETATDARTINAYDYNLSTNTSIPAANVYYYRAPSTSANDRRVFPLSGVAAEMFIPHVMWQFSSAMPGYYPGYYTDWHNYPTGKGTHNLSYNNIQSAWYWGMLNNPTVGERSLYPGIEYSPFRILNVKHSREFFDTDYIPKLEYHAMMDNFLAYQNQNRLGNRGYARNYDGVADKPRRLTYLSPGVKDVWTQHGRVGTGHDNKFHYVNWLPSSNTIGLEQVPLSANMRLWHPFAYLHNLTHWYLPGYTYQDSRNHWHLPMESYVKGHDKLNNPMLTSFCWHDDYQHAPYAESPVHTVRYTNLEALWFGRGSAPGYFNVLDRYLRNLQYLTWSEAHYNSVTTYKKRAMDFGDLQGAKNLVQIHIYDSQGYSSDNIVSWRGMRKLKKLKYLYVRNITKYTINMKYGDIPDQCEYIDLYPPPPPSSNNPYEDEPYRASMVPDSTDLMKDLSRWGTGVVVNNGTPTVNTTSLL